MRKVTLVLLILGLLGVLILAGCDTTDEHEGDNHNDSSAETHDESETEHTENEALTAPTEEAHGHDDTAETDDHAESEPMAGMVMPTEESHGHDDAAETDDHAESEPMAGMVMPTEEAEGSHAHVLSPSATEEPDEHDEGSEVAMTDDEHSDSAAATADHAHEDGEDEHSESEGAHGHGHGAPRVGYIGVDAEGATELDPAELDAFVERVQDEAYEKGDLDQIRFIVMGAFFVLCYLSFAKIKLWNLSERLRNAIDWHTIGTVSGMILIFLVIPSGIIITFFFMPTSTGVYESVEKMADQPVLAFFRNLHNWSSEIFVFLSLLHAARTVSTKTFLSKRKLIWLLGALAFVAGWVAFLSGTFMRGDQEALEGFEHMMYSFSLVPLGDYISEFFSGEFTMMKLTAVHIGLTMFIIALTLTLHVLMRKVHVLVTRRWKKALAYTLALTAFLVVQSIWMEAPFIRGTASGPTISGIEATKPPWPVYFLIQGENWLGADAMVFILAVAFVPLIVFPYVVEFMPLSAKNKSRAGEILFYAGVAAMIIVSYIAAAGEIKAHIFM